MVDYKLFFIERKAVFDVALKLIREGKFQSATMSEIAFHAKLAESTTLYFFNSREKLLSDLTIYVNDAVNDIIAHAATKGSTFQERFFNIWIALYEYYVTHPAAMSFVALSSVSAEEKMSGKKINDSLHDFFKSQLRAVQPHTRPEILAAIFHGNIVTAAKMRNDYHLTYSDDELKSIAKILWDGISSLVLMQKN